MRILNAVAARNDNLQKLQNAAKVRHQHWIQEKIKSNELTRHES